MIGIHQRRKMIQRSENISPNAQPVKAVGLLSGGLDSTLAAKIIRDLGIEVHGVYFAMPWGCCSKADAIRSAESLGINCIVLQLDERYLEIVRKPKYGYGTALNPCVDCRIHMFRRAAQYMRHIGADFVFTGEVLGQRPMSQLRHSMKWIEEGSGLEGRLLRPLCAQALEPTLPEKEGIVDRKKLLQITGRSRKEQLQLAKDNNITDFSPPTGGCLLTNHHFARRMKDTFEYGYRNFRETISLKWGRHFRLNKDFKAILGRDQEENAALRHYAHQEDTILQLADDLGPTCILKGANPSDEILGIAAGLIQLFSKRSDGPNAQIKYWKNSDKNNVYTVEAMKMSAAEAERIKI